MNTLSGEVMCWEPTTSHLKPKSVEMGFHLLPSFLTTKDVKSPKEQPAFQDANYLHTGGKVGIITISYSNKYVLICIIF